MSDTLEERGDGAARQRIDDPHLSLPIENDRRMEAIIAGFLFVGLAAAVVLAVGYSLAWSEIWLGTIFTISLAGFGIGVTAWGKYLMPQGPFEEPREELSSSAEDREVFDATVERGVGIIGRRKLLVRLLGAGSAALGIVLAFPLLRSLGPRPGNSLFTTKWKRGSRLVTADGRVIDASFLETGGVTTVFPEGDAGSAISQTLLIRPGVPGSSIVTKPGRETWGPDGYVAFSKVCTHAGCPVALYMEETQQLLCPCHQSLFDILSGANPVFGPAPRPLPQLPLYIDADGYIRAQAGYDEPVGPGFWYRGND
jgi:ubiquinol-cytochrome c reductase iron-sulfur subunit